MSKLRGLQIVSLTMAFLVSMLGFAPQGVASTTAAPHDGHCGTVVYPCDTPMSLASSEADDAAVAEHGSSSDECPDCEIDGHCITCPNASAADTSPVTFRPTDSQAWRSSLASFPVDVPTTPPDRPPQT